MVPIITIQFVCQMQKTANLAVWELVFVKIAAKLLHFLHISKFCSTFVGVYKNIPLNHKLLLML